MTLTAPQALDEMFALFWRVWQSGTPAIVGNVPAVRWPGVEERNPPAMDSYWARVSTQEIDSPQTTLKSGVAPDEKQRYTSTGLLFVQLFCPMSDAKAKERGDALAELARGAFRGVETPGGVWFRNPRSSPLAPQDNAYRFNIVVEYQFDGIG